MSEPSGLFTTGIVLGLSAGLSPGPLLTLVLSESLRGGIGAGIRIAVAPLMTDAPIIILCLTLLATAARATVFVGIVALLGGCFIVWMAIGNITFKGNPETPLAKRPASLGTGILANLLNPHPYLFWMTVGSPLILKAVGIGAAATGVFLFLFYSCLVGSKMVLAAVAGRYRAVLSSAAYVWTVRCLGIVLVGFAGLFFREGLTRLGWL